eukprot:299229-Rhodomonas_salina.4
MWGVCGPESASGAEQASSGVRMRKPLIKRPTLISRRIQTTGHDRRPDERGARTMRRARDQAVLSGALESVANSWYRTLAVRIGGPGTGGVLLSLEQCEMSTECLRFLCQALAACTQCASSPAG